MRRNFMKKAVAVTLSAAMAFSMSAANNLKTASAATTVSLKTTFKTLEVGQVYKLKLKINKLNWKITKVKSNDSSICKATVKDNSAGNYVRLAAKSEGRTSVWVTVKSSKRKNTARRRCRVAVIDSTPAPTDPTQPAPTDPTQPAPTDPTTSTDPTEAQNPNEVTVTNQEELDAALLNKDLTKLTIKNATGTLNIRAAGEGEDFSKIDLYVQAPDAEINNYATFQNIYIQDISADTWIEHAVANTIRVLAKIAHVKVAATARVSGLIFTQPAGAEARVDVAGKVGELAINASTDMKVTIEDAAAEVAVKVNAAESTVGLETAEGLNLDDAQKAAIKEKVSVDVTAAAAKITTSVPAAITTRANHTDVTIQEGAEGSTYVAEVGATILGAFKNDSKSTIEIKNSKGETVEEVKSGESVESGKTIEANIPPTEATDATTATDPTTATSATQTTIPIVTTTEPTDASDSSEATNATSSSEASEPNENAINVKGGVAEAKGTVDVVSVGSPAALSIASGSSITVDVSGVTVTGVTGAAISLETKDGTLNKKSVEPDATSNQIAFSVSGVDPAEKKEISVTLTFKDGTTKTVKIEITLKAGTEAGEKQNAKDALTCTVSSS